MESYHLLGQVLVHSNRALRPHHKLSRLPEMLTESRCILTNGILPLGSCFKSFVVLGLVFVSALATALNHDQSEPNVFVKSHLKTVMTKMKRVASEASRICSQVSLLDVSNINVVAELHSSARNHRRRWLIEGEAQVQTRETSSTRASRIAKLMPNLFLMCLLYSYRRFVTPD